MDIFNIIDSDFNLLRMEITMLYKPKKFLIALVAFIGLSINISANPIGADLFIRGSFNNWGVSNKLSFDLESSHFSITLSLPAGKHEFKIADSAWTGKRTFSGAQKAATTLKLNEEKKTRFYFTDI